MNETPTPTDDLVAPPPPADTYCPPENPCAALRLETILHGLAHLFKEIEQAEHVEAYIGNGFKATAQRTEIERKIQDYGVALAAFRGFDDEAHA